MNKPGYKINMNHLETAGGIVKLKHDGFTETQIRDAAHKLTDQQVFTHKTRTEQREIIQNLYDRSKSE